MVTCKNCGEEVRDEAKFCQNCGTEIVIEEDLTGTKFCSSCGFKMPKATKFCPECGAPTDRAPRTASATVMSTDKSPGLAAVLSFFIVGLGQIYLGLNRKGIILFLAAVASGILMMILIGWITWLIVWGYSIYDAYNSAEKMRSGIAVEDGIDFDNLF
ncbi:zinc-ribbon domain-containing protein [Methanobrevibacter sp.]|uniref:zinc-ribbon domain-containing protein n=1 Tax=Methanobrevibacter sp. TaxID=66852 RepID=UPI0025DD2CE2|nr:zinc-ribbon domain-containing protein [Methanobrevibacter sp.]MBQ2665589.1 zinc-ribbon domain-containing protein [Methanobrevibacter sp.]